MLKELHPVYYHNLKQRLQGNDPLVSFRTSGRDNFVQSSSGFVIFVRNFDNSYKFFPANLSFDPKSD